MTAGTNRPSPAAGPAPALPTQAPPYMDQHEAANYLSITVRMLRGLIGKRAVAYVPVGPKCIRFRKADLDRFMDSRVVRAAP